MVKKFNPSVYPGLLFYFILFAIPFCGKAQVFEDSIPVKKEDTLLRIKNFTPYFTLHVDSTLEYHFEINKDPKQYFWFLRNMPVGFKINKDNGVLKFKADKSFFLSGKLKYDNEYKVNLGVQNLNNDTDKVDTTFTLVFYNTEIIPSKVKPTVSGTLNIDEGDTLNFKLQCEEGSFPIESITYYCNFPIRSATPVTKCGDDFSWWPTYDFIKEDEIEKQKLLTLNFIGVDKFFNRDTAIVRIMVNQAINFPQRLMEYNSIVANVGTYVVQLKSTFRILDQKIRRTKNTRTTFDLTSASTALGGTIFLRYRIMAARPPEKLFPVIEKFLHH